MFATVGANKNYATAGGMYGVSATRQAPNSPFQEGAQTTGAAVRSGVPSPPAGNPTTILPQLDGTIFGQPVTHFFLLAAAAIGVYTLIHKYTAGIEKDLAVPRISLGAFWSIGVQAILFIFLAKAALTKYRIPGLSELVGSV